MLFFAAGEKRAVEQQSAAIMESFLYSACFSSSSADRVRQGLPSHPPPFFLFACFFCLLSRARRGSLLLSTQLCLHPKSSMSPVALPLGFACECTLLVPPPPPTPTTAAASRAASTARAMFTTIATPRRAGRRQAKLEVLQFGARAPSRRTSLCRWIAFCWRSSDSCTGRGA